MLTTKSARICLKRYAASREVTFCLVRKKVAAAAVWLAAASLFTACISDRVVSSTPVTTTQAPPIADILREQFSNESATPTRSATPAPSPSVSPTPVPPSATILATAATSTPNPPTQVLAKTIQPSPTPTVTAVPQVWVELNAVHLRQGPGVDYPVIRLLYNGEVMEVIAVFGGTDGWYNVRLREGISGWVSSSVVKPVDLFPITIIPTAATIPATTTPTPTYTPTATNTPTPQPPPPTQTPQPPLPTLTPQPPTPTTVPPTPTINPYP